MSWKTSSPLCKPRRTRSQDLDDQPQYKGYDPSKLNTSFRYELTDKTGKNVARAGLADLDICLPYTLAFVRELESVEYPNRLLSLEEPEEERVDGEVQILSVTVADPVEFDDQEMSSHRGAEQRSDHHRRAGQANRETACRSSRWHPNVPRLFCDFPLLGTEAFPFPVIINNPTFNPTEPRDGIFLTKTERPNRHIDHNKAILKEALALYLLLLDHASENDWQNLHLLAATKIVGTELAKMDQPWYKAAILTPMRQTLLHTKIVRTAANTLAPIHSRRRLEQYLVSERPLQRGAPRHLALLQELDSRTAPGAIGHRNLERHHLARVQQADARPGRRVRGARTERSRVLQGELDGTDVHLWLMNFYATLETDETAFQSVVAKRRDLPQPERHLQAKGDLTRDAGDIDVTLLDILKLLGDDLRDQLLDAAITTDA